MKPWLFDILACPIDKFFPLELYIFKFETKSEVFQSFLEKFEKRMIDEIKNEEIIEYSKEDQIVKIRDNIILEKTPLNKYLQLILKSIDEFDNIFDKTNNNLSNKCFQIINSAIKPKILDFSKKINHEKIEEILPELYFINKIKLEIEIESGLLFCRNCFRWYPIIENIPQMLPDEYRSQQNEIEFLKTNKNLLDNEFLNQDLRPFNLYSK